MSLITKVMMDDDNLFVSFNPKSLMDIDLNEDYDGQSIFDKKAEESSYFNYECPPIFDEEIEEWIWLMTLAMNPLSSIKKIEECVNLHGDSYDISTIFYEEYDVNVFHKWSK